MALILKNSKLEASLFANCNPPSKAQTYSMDDINIDYMSILGLEDMKRRFSEEVVDMDLKDTLRLKKMYRQIQHHVRGHQDKGSWLVTWQIEKLNLKMNLNIESFRTQEARPM